MPFWPFKKQRTNHEPLAPEQLRDLLISTAKNEPGNLRAVCETYKADVPASLDVIAKLPDDAPRDDQSIHEHIQSLLAVAQCLAQQCGAPELLHKLTESQDDDENPFTRFNDWVQAMPARLKELEYNELIFEAREFASQAKSLMGNTARQHEAMVNGRLAELLFHSGAVESAKDIYQYAYDLCTGINDVEGQFAYLSSLLEVHRYLDDGQAIEVAKKIRALLCRFDQPTEAIDKRIAQFEKGEPLCRLVCILNDKEYELDELTEFAEGKYQFIFCRNRLTLQKAIDLTGQGNQLASAGNHADALERYHDANEVDPYDPDSVYQSGVCLIELGAYSKAREAFEEVERLAPGWFQCRSDRWIAGQLDQGLMVSEQFELMRVLQDGGMDPQQALPLAKQAVERFLEFAPLLLIQGNLYRESGQEENAIKSYRDGIAAAEEPDIESRLLCALAGLIPKESPERTELIDRALSLKGNLLAQATAKLIQLG